MEKKTNYNEFLPPTQDEIMLIQPNNVTFGEYDITEWQENLLTLIGDRLQSHMSKEQEFNTDLFGQPYVTVICDEAGGLNNKTKVIQEARDLSKKLFSFRWLHPKIHKTIETSGVIVTTIHDVKGTNTINITVNPWAVPFLLYYGVGVGGTRYSKAIALTIPGMYSKRIYKILCSQRDRKEYFYDIEQFRKDLSIPLSYTNSLIRTRILEPAKKAIKESGSDVWFDFKMIAKKKTKGRKPKADTIIFLIKALHPREAGGEQFQIYNTVYNWMVWAFGQTSSKSLDITEKLTATGRLKDVYNRALFYDDKICSGEMTKDHAINSLKKMLREEYGIK